MKRPRKSTRPLAARKLPPQCLCCGTENPWVENPVEMTAPFRGREHTIRSKVNQCRHCDAISTTPEQAAAVSTLVRDIHRQWISDEFKRAQRELGFTIDGLAKATRIPRATVARASSGGSLIEGSLEDLLWLKIRKMREDRREAWMAASASGSAKPDVDRRLIYVSVTTSSTAVFAAARKVFCSTSPLAVRQQGNTSSESIHSDCGYEYA